MQLPWLKQRLTAQGCLGIEINHGRAWAVHRTQRGVVSSYIAELMSQALRIVRMDRSSGVSRFADRGLHG